MGVEDQSGSVWVVVAFNPSDGEFDHIVGVYATKEQAESAADVRWYHVVEAEWEPK